VEPINELTAQVDILPTLAELCGLELPKDHLNIHGQSLVSMLNGTQNANNRMLVTDSQRLEVPRKWKNSSVMQNKWRLINGTELYNLEQDKSQANDVASQYPERVSKMRSF